MTFVHKPKGSGLHYKRKKNGTCKKKPLPALHLSRFHESVGILLQQKAFRHEALRAFGDLLDVVVLRTVSLLEGRPRIFLFRALRLRLRKLDKRAVAIA